MKRYLAILEKNTHLLKAFHIGLERETLRVKPGGKISGKSHPASLGSTLTHPYIGTDFAESQLELRTPPLKDEKTALAFLRDVHLFVAENIKGELLWPFSMPSALPDDLQIPLAQYGSSNLGQQRRIYREGLARRYGAKMQTISSIHYNFSFDQPFWDVFNKNNQKEIDKTYFAIIRNFLRFGWIFTYLFGAAPCFDRSYLGCDLCGFETFDKLTCLGRYATSYRMSGSGYYSKVQCQTPINMNDLESYLHDLTVAVSTSHPEYKKIGMYEKQKQIQLNTHILQTENEHYSRIRPKNSGKENEGYLSAIKKKGVGWIEIRSVDLDPFSPLGIGEEQLTFLKLFVFYLFCKASPQLSTEELKEIPKNQNFVALYGRKPDLFLTNKGKNISFKKWGLKLLKEMEPIADLLQCRENLERQKQKFISPLLTPSAKILAELKENKESFLSYGLFLARENMRVLHQKPLSNSKYDTFEKWSQKSFKMQQDIEQRDAFILKGYEDLEGSTQVLIREALKRRIKVEVIDREGNILRLSKGKKIEYVKQATKTSKDSYISYHLMENKHVTKKILREKGLRVPEGNQYMNLSEALDDYPHFKNSAVVIKPNQTNYGIGIHFVSPCNKQAYSQAVQHSLTLDTTVLIEEFVPGKEYRFLIIGNKVLSVLHRDPANVIGNGKNTIAQLAKKKNLNPKSFKIEKDYIRIGKEEKAHLKKQGLSPKSIPKKGKKVYLRTNSNVSTGGDPIDVTELVDKSYHKIAKDSAKALEANICGVDMIIPNPRDKATKTNYAIIELNFNPAIFMHSYPFKGVQRDTGGAVLDFLGLK